MSSEADPLVGTTLGGRYAIKRFLGKGAMGKVYLAEHVELGRPVAIKFLTDGHAAEKEFQERFLLEARTAARIEHPNVVSVYDAALEAETAGPLAWLVGNRSAPLLYFAMQFVDGGDLDRHARTRALEPREVLEIGLEIARALAAAWAEGIVHLDIKPANVLRGRTQWKVADFGLARQLTAAPEGEKVPICGTPAFMAPEQWQQGVLDGRTDLYAMGVTLYWLLARGRYPFEVPHKSGISAWYRAHTELSPQPLHDLAPGLPEGVASLVRALIEKDPGKRPDSAALVAEALEDLLAAERRSASPRAPTPASTPASLPASTPAADEAVTLPAGARAPASALIGRASETAAFAEALARARTGAGSVLSFTGPRGIGLTCLLGELARIGARSGALVIEGRGGEGEPLAFLRRALATVLGVDPGAAPDSQREQLRSALARLSGADGTRAHALSLEALLLGDPARASAAPRLPAATLASFVARRASTESPVVLLADDLPEADAATRDFVRAVAASAAAAPIVLAVAAPTTPEGAAALGELARERAVSSFTLRPLTPVEIDGVAARALAGAGTRPRISSALLAALTEPAHGIPAVPVRAASAALRSGQLRIVAGEVAGDPASLREHVQRTRDALVGRAEESTVLRIDSPAAFDRSAIEKELARGVTRRMLNDLAGSIASLDGARAGAESAACPPGLRAWVLRELATSLASAGERLEEAARLGATAAALAEQEEDLRAAIESRLVESLALYLARRYGEALASVDAAIKAYARTDDPRIAAPALRRLECELFHRRGLVLSRMGAGEQRAARAALDEALRRAVADGQQDLYAMVAQSLGDLLLRAKELPEAERHLKASLDYKLRLGDLPGLAMAYGSLGRLAHVRGDRAAAVSWFERDLEIAVRIGDRRGTGVAANSLGEQLELRSLDARSADDRSAAARAYDTARDAAVASRNEVDAAISAFYRGRFLRRGPDASQHAAGMALLLESLRALKRLGRQDEARTVVNAVLEFGGSTEGESGSPGVSAGS